MNVEEEVRALRRIMDRRFAQLEVRVLALIEEGEILRAEATQPQVQGGSMKGWTYKELDKSSE